MDVPPPRPDEPDVYIRIHIEEDNVQKGASQILSVIRPHWKHDKIIYKIFTDGITNKLIGCFNSEDDGDVVLVRVYGHKTDLLIDRKAERRNIKVLHEAGLAPCLYAVFENGLAYQYVAGSILTTQSVVLPGVWRLVARQMAAMHNVKLDNQIAVEPVLWTKGEKFLSLVPEPYTSSSQQIRFEELITPLSELRTELEELKSRLSGLGSPVVFAHNDLLLGNVIYDSTQNRVTFIDYEYADYNYQAFDIGNHFAEFVGINEIDYSLYPSEKFQLAWLREYLEAREGIDPSPAQLRRLHAQVNQFALAAHFFWGLWALIQAEYSTIDFDFLEYAAVRFKEYYDKKDEFLSLNESS